MFVALVFFLFFGTIVCEECIPAVKGTKYVLSGKFQHVLKEPVETIWLRDKTPVSMCNSKMACYDYSDVSTMTSLRSLGDGMFQYSLTIHNVSDLDNRVWSLKYLGLASLRHKKALFSCKMKIYVSSVLILKNCPSVVEEGSHVNCICQTKEHIQDHFSIDWYNKTDKLSTTDDHTLSYTASRYMQGLECRGKSSDDQETLPISYEPIIIAKPANIECKTNYNGSHLIASCLMERIFPSPTCLFILKENEVELQAAPEFVQYKNVPNPIEPLYYNTECLLQIPVLHTPGNKTASLIVYPNVTGTANNEIYAVKSNLMFNVNMVLRHSEKQIRIFCQISLIILPVVCLLASAMLLLILAFALPRLRKHKSTMKDTSTQDETVQGNIYTFSESSMCKNSNLLTFPTFIWSENDLIKCNGESIVTNGVRNLNNDCMNILLSEQEVGESFVVSDKDRLLS